MTFNNDISLAAALQFGGLLPCLFVIVLLCTLARDSHRIIIPAGYFLSLACSFILPLRSLLGLESESIFHGLLFIEKLQPALCYLLILQFLSGSVPRPYQWMILGLPVIGGGLLIYSSEVSEALCTTEGDCLSATSLHMLYNIFSSSVIFLLLTVQFSRARQHVDHNELLRRHTYWLVVSLVCLYLALLALDLARLDERIAEQDHLIADTIIRISFIYLILTSLFRVFDQKQPFGIPSLPPAAEPRPVDPNLVLRIEQAMQTAQLYREMGFTRETLAKHVGVSEHALSRIINQHFGKNFNEYVNFYRVDEAKKRLLEEGTPVTAIAFEVGFSSIASFNRVFKTLTGCSPTEYRTQGGDEMKRA